MTKTPCMYAQSAVIPYTGRGASLRVLLITSRRSGRWVPPKGIIECDMSPAASARKEAMEEAGVEGDVQQDRLFGTYHYEKWGATCSVQVFGMRVTHQFDDWPEADQRVREWMSVDEASRRVREPELKDIIRRIPTMVQG